MACPQGLVAVAISDHGFAQEDQPRKVEHALVQASIVWVGVKAVGFAGYDVKVGSSALVIKCPQVAHVAEIARTGLNRWGQTRQKYRRLTICVRSANCLSRSPQ